MRISLVIVIVLLINSFAIAQGEGNNWYFGSYAGLSFSTDPPTLLNDGHLTTGEGCASVSGKDGALAFYTDGNFVYDANHNIMPNGNGDLLGSPSSTQSAVICPKPGTYNYGAKRYDAYFIITIDVNAGPSGIRFSEVDMSLNGGLGDVVVSNKNIHLMGTSTTEGASIAKHANGCDFWIIGKEVGTTNVNVFAVTTAGVNLTPIVSSSMNVGSALFGSIKVSPDNKLLAIVNNPSIEVFDFNNSTGVLTSKFTDVIGTYAYSVEFSSNSKVVYCTILNNANIYQYDLTLANNLIAGSQQIIGTTANTIGFQMCGLQLAPNGKVYAALHGVTRLGVINNPNVLGVGCGYNDNGVSLVGVNSFSGTSMISTLGLPAFPSFFVTEPVSIQASYLCYRDQTEFKLSDTTDMDNIDWFWSSVGATLPTAPSSTIWEPTVPFSTPGDYAVLAVAYYPCFIDSIRDTITITNVNSVDLGNDTVLCYGNTLTLDAGVGYDYYTWHDGSTNQTFTADTSGTYSVEVSNVGSNLVVNGDFEDGNTGFSSEYNNVLQQGGYIISNNVPPPSWNQCSDHTSGSGNMMVTDAACGSNGVTAGVNLWCQTVNVSPNTDYLFSLWTTNVTASSANIAFFIDGTQQGNTQTSTGSGCQWEQISQIWNSGSSTSIELCIKELTMVCSGADFAIDDIFFAELCTTTDDITITAGETPHAEFSLVDSCEYQNVVYTDASTIASPETIATWSWDVDNDGTEDYNIQNPSHLFTAGNHTSKLTVTSALGCSKDTTMPVVTFPKPTADFTFTNKCLYDSIPFVDASSVSGTDVIAGTIWNFGENSLLSVDAQIPNPYYTYSTAGTYTITEIVTTLNGCLDTITKQVEAYDVPVASFSVGNSCLDVATTYNESSTIANGSIANWNWDFGDLNYGTNQNETNTYASDGNYDVQLVVTSDHICRDTIVQSLTVFANPQVAFSMSNNCLEDETDFTDNTIINAPGVLSNYIWSFGDASALESAQNPTHTYQTEGTYDVKLIVVSADNCTDTLTQSVTVYPLPAVGFSATEICVNTPPTVFTNTSAIASGANVGFAWSFGDAGSSTSMQENPSLDYGTHGNYDVTLAVVSDNGCADTLTQTIKVKHIPNANFVQDTTGGCAPICVNFAGQSTDSIGIATWSWKFEDAQGEGSHKYETYCYDNEGIFEVELIVMNTEGCFDVVTKPGLIKTFGYPTAEFELSPSETTILDSDIEFVNSSSDTLVWMWSFEDGTFDSLNYEPVHHYGDTGVYMVGLTIYNANGCSDVVYHQVMITPVENIFVPTAFSPNGDGENDVLYVRGYLSELYFSVYDRWGKKVFESKDQTMGWNGTINGKQAVEGVYMWYLQTTINGEPKKLKGDVSLMR